MHRGCESTARSISCDVVLSILRHLMMHACRWVGLKLLAASLAAWTRLRWRRRESNASMMMITLEIRFAREDHCVLLSGMLCQLVDDNGVGRVGLWVCEVPEVLSQLRRSWRAPQDTLRIRSRYFQGPMIPPRMPQGTVRLPPG